MSTVSILTGPERRRRWLASEKVRIVEESLQPGADVRAIAQRYDGHPKLLHPCRRRARLAAERQLNLVPVMVAAGRRPRGSTSGGIEIELGDGVRIRVDAGVDEAALGRVLRALGR